MPPLFGISIPCGLSPCVIIHLTPSRTSPPYPGISWPEASPSLPSGSCVSILVTLCKSLTLRPSLWDQALCTFSHLTVGVSLRPKDSHTLTFSLPFSLLLTIPEMIHAHHTGISPPSTHIQGNLSARAPFPHSGFQVVTPASIFFFQP